MRAGWLEYLGRCMEYLKRRIAYIGTGLEEYLDRGVSVPEKRVRKYRESVGVPRGSTWNTITLGRRLEYLGNCG